MDTIIAYLDNMFSALPKTQQLERLKQEILLGMEEKYVELKREGKSEHEAIGIVISEFGNIEELTAELGIQSVKEEQQVEQQLFELSREEVYEYISVRRHTGFWIGIGVFLCIAGVALLIALDTILGNTSLGTDNGSLEIGTFLGLVGMFVFIAVAVGIFIYCGMKLERYKNIEQGFQLPYVMKMEIQHNQALFAPTYRASIIIGVSLCILSPSFIFLATFINDDFSPFGVTALLLTIASAVFLFIYYGNIQGAYTKLIDKSLIAINPEKKEEERVIGLIQSIIWPLATIVFLYTGFVHHRWDINWVIFPITGILFGMVSNVYRSLMRNNNF